MNTTCGSSVSTTTSLVFKMGLMVVTYVVVTLTVVILVPSGAVEISVVFAMFASNPARDCEEVVTVS